MLLSSYLLFNFCDKNFIDISLKTLYKKSILKVQQFFKINFLILNVSFFSDVHLHAVYSSILPSKLESYGRNSTRNENYSETSESKHVLKF